MAVMRSLGNGRTLPPHANVREDASEYVIKLDVSDFTESELTVETLGPVVTVRETSWSRRRTRERCSACTSGSRSRSASRTTRCPIASEPSSSTGPSSCTPGASTWHRTRFPSSQGAG